MQEEEEWEENEEEEGDKEEKEALRFEALMESDGENQIPGLSNQEELEIKGTPGGAAAPSCWKEALRRFKQLIRTPPHLPLEDLREENLS